MVGVCPFHLHWTGRFRSFTSFWVSLGGAVKANSKGGLVLVVWIMNSQCTQRLEVDVGVS